MPKSLDDHHETRAQLTRSILDRIQVDEMRAENESVRSLLAYFRENLFDRQFELKKAFKACQIEPKNFAPLFRSEVGENPQRYFMARRIEAASTLLINTNIDIYQAGLLVGYGTGQAFSQAFERSTKLRPKAYRAKYRKLKRRSSLPPELHERVSQLEGSGARELLELLHNQNPELSESKPTIRYSHGIQNSSRAEIVVCDETLDELNASRFWKRIQGMSRERQEKEIRSEGSRLPALFGLLKAVSLEESRLVHCLSNSHR